MRDSVKKSFNSFTTKFEGRVSWMYLDIKGLVTVAVGNLIDPVDAALGLPFVHKSTKVAATRDEIRAEWTMLKGKQDLAKKGHKACEAITDLRMTDQGMDDLVLAKLTSNESVLKKSFSDWDAWPADAQLGVLSMAWALGPGFPAHWTKFTAAAKVQDWTAAAANCKINETGNPGVKPRNEADVVLFTNAAAVKAKGLDPATLYYPADARTVAAPTPTTPTTAPAPTPESGDAGTEEHVPVDTSDPMPPEESTDEPTGESTDETTDEDSSEETTDDGSSDEPTDETTDDSSSDETTDDDSSDETSDEGSSDETTDEPTDDGSSDDGDFEDTSTDSGSTEESDDALAPA